MLADLLTDRDAILAAFREGSLLWGDLADSTLAWQVGRQGPAAVPLGPAGGGRS